MDQKSASAKSKTSINLPNPWSKANPLSLLFFTWIWPIFYKGTKKDLEPNDLYRTPNIYETKGLAEKFTK